MRTVCLVLTACIGIQAWAPAAGADSHVPGRALAPPVDAAIGRRFRVPESRWGPGHRGIDYRIAAGHAVRAAGDGAVVFAGRVGGAYAVTIDHGGGLQTTYSRLQRVHVHSGDSVTEGRWVGTTGEAHPGRGGGLHFGVKLHGSYVDPEAFLVPLDVTGAIHLAPVGWLPPEELPAPFRDAFDDRGREGARCTQPADLPGRPPPPNDNIAVAVAGIASKTAGRVDAAIYERGPQLLGYRRVYRFSYKGHRGRRLHLPYDRRHTYGDLDRAARRLRGLLARIARRHPGADVDLLAHSQGGVVARRFLQRHAAAGDRALPRVAHVVTFATPHGGAPLAALPEALEGGSLTGGRLVDVASWGSRRRGWPVPDPRADAVAQLAPGSFLLTEMAREDVLFGTRALALGGAADLVVPADRARWQGKRSHTLPPAAGAGHGGITSAPRALSLAYQFLRDGAPVCTSGADVWGPRLGTVIGFAQSQLGWLYGRAEDALGGRLYRLGRGVVRLLRRRLGRRVATAG